MGKRLIAPIAVFLYNRPSSTQRLFDCLLKSPLFTQSIVYVFVDGPKDDGDAREIKLVKEVIANIAHPDLRINASARNKGLQRSIMDGVSLVCNNHESVIVFEDDLEVSSVSLEYFNEALTKYKDNSNVYSVSGYLPGPSLPDYSGRAIILPYAHSWGWATWSRAWDGFVLDSEYADSCLRSQIFRNWFNLGGLRNYSDLLALANKGVVDSWYVYWLLHIMRNRGVSIFPSQSYVRNVGSGGTHASTYNPLNYILKQKVLCEKLIEFPEKIEIDYWVLDLLPRTTEARVQRLSSWIGSTRRKLLLRFRA